MKIIFMKKLFLISFVFFGLVSFSVAHAADQLVGSASCPYGNMDSITGIINWASCLLMQIIVPFLFALATAGFIYGVINYYLNPGNEKKREEGKKFIVGGLIALFMMTAMWGIVKVFTNTFEIKNVVPQLPSGS